MTFRIDGMTIRGRVETRQRGMIPIPQQSLCESCEWFQSAVSRCVHPRHGCTSGGHRIRPWEHVRACPVSEKLAAGLPDAPASPVNPR
jgi:hypothetical protein